MALICECGNRLEISAVERQRLVATRGRITCPQCGKRSKIVAANATQKMIDTPGPVPVTSPSAATSTDGNMNRWKWQGWAALSAVVALVASFFVGREPARIEVKNAGDENAIKDNVTVLDLADLIEEIEPAVIVLHVTLKNGSAIGSGFVVEPRGIAVTNHHVVDRAIKAMARYADGRECEVEGVLFADPDRDIAIIKLSNADSSPTLKLAKTLPRKGESTIAFGAPEGLTFTATEGIVSAIRSESDAENDASPRVGTWIQTSTAISHGSSGGPLLNRHGEVIGVNTFFLKSGQSLNFATASTEVIEALNLSKDRPITRLTELARIQREREEDAIVMLTGHPTGIGSVTYNPDGTLIASVRGILPPKLFDTATGQETVTLKGTGDSGWSVAFSPDGHRIAAARGFAVKLWDTATGEETMTLGEHSYGPSDFGVGV